MLTYLRRSSYLALLVTVAATFAATVVVEDMITEASPPAVTMKRSVSRPVTAGPTSPGPGDIARLLRQFDTARAMQHVRVLSEQVGRRPGGSEGEKRAAEYIAAAFDEYGYNVRRQSDIPIDVTGRTTQNVLAVSHADTESNDVRCVLLGAHYDSIGRGHRSPGANDNATGVAVMLEVARLLADVSLPYRLQFMAFGAEERQGPTFDHHHYGSRAALRKYAAKPRSWRLAGMVSIDMVGVGDGLYARNMNIADGWLVDHFQRSGQQLGLPIPFKEDARGCSDHEPFESYGIPSVWVERLPDPSHHSPRDRMRNISPEHLQTAGRLCLHALLTIEADQLE